MQVIFCQNCQCVLPLNKKRCPLCQSQQRSSPTCYVFCRKDGTPVPLSEPICPTCQSSVKRGSRWASPTLVFLLGCGLFVLLFEIHTFIFSTYQPATCQIQAAQVASGTDRNGTTYHAVFDYTVINAQGQVVLSQTNDSLGLPSYGDREQAQQDVDQYVPGSTYPCQYSPLAWRKAILLAPQNREISLIERMLLFALVSVFASLEVYLLSLVILRTWRLSRHGMMTTGTVVHHVIRGRGNRSGASRGSIFSLVEFHTRSEPPLKAQTSVAGLFQLHGRMKVLYDPLNPVENVRASFTGSPLRVAPVVYALFLVLLLLAGSGVLAFFSIML